MQLYYKETNFRSTCSISCALEIIGDKWTLLIIRDILFAGSKSFGDFRSSPEKIATNILSDRLEKLVSHGILVKSVNKDNRLKFDYKLTKIGKDLEPIIRAIGELLLSNRIVMAPMTRSRAINNIPNDLMATYYRQRATAGLIITEGVAPSPNGLGYARIPGVYKGEQIEGWKLTTDAVHSQGGKIFMQLMHTGRITHPLNMPKEAIAMAPSAIPASGEMYTDQEGMQAYPVPREMTKSDIDLTVQEFAIAAKNAIHAGFDGVEIHGANGYLVDQFLNTRSNHRTDEYGGSDENRTRFALEVASAIAGEIGADRTGIRISPYNTFNDLEIFDSVEHTYEQLAFELGKTGLAYIHMIDVGNMGGYDVPMAFKEKIKAAFKGPVIINGGLDKAKAEKVLNSGIGDLTSFGAPFIANPDLVERLKSNLSLSEADPATFYTPGKEGYLSYE